LTSKDVSDNIENIGSLLNTYAA